MMKTTFKRWSWLGCVLILLASSSPTQAFYNPSTGRWLSRDPIGEQGGKNIYAFVDNKPLQEIDVWGLEGSREDCYATCREKFGRSGVGGARVYAACMQDCNQKYPPDPTGFALCKRDVNPEGFVENAFYVGFRIAHPLTPTDHAHLHYKRCKNCERVGWGIGGTTPGAPPKNETLFNPTDCKSCKKVDSLLQYGAPGKKGTEATDSEILGCISEVPTSKNYKAIGKGQYNCMDWAKEAASKCGLKCN